jgi:hypothetical protein
MVYVWAALVAAVVSLAELATRYKDDPWLAVRSGPSVFYTLINAAVAACCVWVLLHYDPNAFAVVSVSDAARADGGAYDSVKVVFICGLGSLALLRASVFKARVHDTDVSVGPAIVIEQILKVVDRAIDRKLAERRADIVAELVPRVDFANQGIALFTVSLALLQNHTPDEKKKIKGVYEGLKANEDIDARTRSTILVLSILDSLGSKALRHVVNTINSTSAP